MRKRGPKPAAGAPYYELGRSEPIKREYLDFARRRIGGFAHFSEAHRPFIDLLANAYICGLADATEVAALKGPAGDDHESA